MLNIVLLADEFKILIEIPVTKHFMVHVEWLERTLMYCSFWFSVWYDWYKLVFRTSITPRSLSTLASVLNFLNVCYNFKKISILFLVLSTNCLDNPVKMRRVLSLYNSYTTSGKIHLISDNKDEHTRSANVAVKCPLLYKNYRVYWSLSNFCF